MELKADILLLPHHSLVVWYTVLLEGNSTNFTYQSLFIGLVEYNCICEKEVKAFCGSRGSSIKSDKLPHVMLIKWVLVEYEDLKSENKKNRGVALERSYLSRPAWGYISYY